MEERTSNPDAAYDEPGSTVAPAHRPPWKWILIGAGAIIVAGILVYLIGYYQGRSRVADVEERLAVVHQELEESREQLRLARDRGRLAQALSLVYRTMLDLDDRNFGTANSRLQLTAQLLEGVESQQLNTAELQALQREIRQTDIRVATDLENQRSLITGFAERLRSLLPEEMAAAPAP